MEGNKQDVHIGLSEKEERSHERAQQLQRPSGDHLAFHAMANENFVVMKRFGTHAYGPGVLKRRDA